MLRLCSATAYRLPLLELVGMESIRGGALVELMYTVRLKKGVTPASLISEFRPAE